MLQKFLRIPPRVWLVLWLIIAVVVIETGLRIGGLVSPTVTVYLVSPILLGSVGLVSARLLLGARLRIRQSDEKIIRLIGLITVWFVIYVLSGLVFTYVRNSLTSSPVSIAVNIWAYAIPIAAFEYMRHRILAATPRRLIRVANPIIAIVLALPFMNLGQFAGSLSNDQLAAAFFVDIVGSLATSAVLTYLALCAGLKAQLIYSLGLLAIVLLPPVIPKHDWYILGMSSVLLSIATYMVISKYSTHEPGQSRRTRTYRSSRAVSVMFVLVMVAMVMFMTGVFAYKPMVVMSNSMMPVYGRGAMVVVQKMSTIDIREGDIVQYEAAGKMVTHRVQQIKPDPAKPDGLIFITKGDNSPSRDKPVSQSQIIGVVRSAVPYVGYPTVWLQETIKGRQSL